MINFGTKNSIFVDRSVDPGDIPDEAGDERIRRIIRDRYLRDSTVTIVLVGKETKHRKHVDWEIHSSMYGGAADRRSGIVVINLPGISDYFVAPHGEAERKLLYPEIMSWKSAHSREEYERRYPYMPDRIVDNLLKPDVKISVVPWNRLNPERLEFLIEAAFRTRFECGYDLRNPMKRANS